MDVFADYSAYYDLLYADKDTALETNYTLELVRSCNGQPPKNILEVGCGTGRYSLEFARRGIRVEGIDLSAEMIAVAKANLEQMSTEKNRPRLQVADARSYRSSEEVDAVMALFHVLSYQTKDKDVDRFLESAFANLNAGGVFVFDFWYGPAVLWNRPSVRVREVRNDSLRITRVASPDVKDAANVVDVNYSIFVEDRRTGAIGRLNETHSMRYFDLKELEGWLQRVGFVNIRFEEWLTGAPPATSTWGVCGVARKPA